MMFRFLLLLELLPLLVCLAIDWSAAVRTLVCLRIPELTGAGG